MRFRDRPLLPDGLDAGIYLERFELEKRLLQPLLAERNVLLLGEAGSGKSTLLRRAIGRLESDGQPAVLVNAALADDATELLELIEAALEEHVGGGRNVDPGDGTRASMRSLSAARRLHRYKPVVILIDGLIDAEIGYDVFGRLRDELWELGHAWAVAARARDSASLRTPPADAFWGAVVEIPPLDLAETERLLELGLDEQERELVGRDLVIAGAYPRFVIRSAQEALARSEEPGAPGVQANVLMEIATGLGRAEAMAMAELLGLGRPVSAHDPELLERMGWSRPYAQRILSVLEGRGLLRSIPERSDRPGRPRKLYEPNPNPDLH